MGAAKLASTHENGIDETASDSSESSPLTASREASDMDLKALVNNNNDGGGDDHGARLVEPRSLDHLQPQRIGQRAAAWTII